MVNFIQVIGCESCFKPISGKHLVLEIVTKSEICSECYREIKETKTLYFCSLECLRAYLKKHSDKELLQPRIPTWKKIK